jgi:arylsulfatase A-like enzyme
VLADAVVHPHGAQPPLQRRRLHHELATGYPGYDGRMPFENRMLPEMLVGQGYNTFCVGKWHLSPAEDNTAAGPFHRWPLGRGFERFYGFLGGETNQWYPDLTRDNASVPQPRSPEEGYHLSEDLADQAIRMILDAHVNAPEKPFYMYYATGAAPTPRITSPRNGRTTTRAASTTAGTPTARRSSPASRSWVSSRRTRSSRRAIPTWPSGRRCRRTSAGSTGA